MAELASGAVSALLGVIRNEQDLLGGVKGDVQFIKEEMESMNSFLLHLARTEPPGGEHDEQVRTWMSQVRLLAQDSNNCIDLYLYRGNPDIHLATEGFWRYLLWAPWFIRKMMAQRHGAVQLRELKERAREVGERRLRYGVEIPAKAAAAAAAGAAATSLHVAGESDAGDEEQDGGHQLVPADHSTGTRRAFDPCSLEDYFKRKLHEWKQVTDLVQWPVSIATVAPDILQEDEACALAREALDAWQVHHVLVVDIPAVHDDSRPLRPKEILYYILRELQLQQQEATSDHHQRILDSWSDKRKRTKAIYSEQRKLFSKIKDTIQQMKVDSKLENVKSEILRMIEGNQLQRYLEQMKDGNLGPKKFEEPLGLLLLLLKLAAAEQDQVGKKKAKRRVAALYKDFIKATGSKLKHHMEAGSEQPPPICLSSAQYEDILQEMFPKTSDSNAQEQHKKITTTTVQDDHIKEIADKVQEEILRRVFQTPMSKAQQEQCQEQDSSAVKRATKTALPEDPAEEISYEDEQARHKQETIEKIDNIKGRIKAQMKIKGIVDRIGEHLKGDIMIILKVDMTMDASRWEETRQALSRLYYKFGALIITKKSTDKAKEYCSPEWEPIDFSLVGLYHDTVLNLRSPNVRQDNCNSQLFRDILDNCEQHELCMKIFAHALHSKPMRRNEELYNLCSTLQAVSPKSLSNIAQKMIKFSYNDLSKECKSCLLYLAIFPQGFKFRRSDLIGRWVAEGMVTTEDWSWPSSVHKAERCFDMLINRWLVYPTDVDVTGDIKSFMVSDQVNEFITTIAKKQNILRIRLSYHLAHHFSISNDLRLRGSDTIDKFLRKLHASSRFSSLKVLDLENCQCFGQTNKDYLKDICCKILLLKYLNLRGTNVTHLPKEINKLHELEVLDISHTMVPEYATRNIRLLKLKRLLAGNIDASPSITYTDARVEECPSSVQVPDKIEKMLDMEVLSNVTARSDQALKDIGWLCHLRKFGVVIEEKDSRIQKLLEAISNMHECLHTLSITILPINGREGTPSSRRTAASDNDDYMLEFPLHVLDSLSINGTTQKVQLLQKLLDKDHSQLAKVTLRSTLLKQDDLNVLAMLPKLLCMRFGDKAYTETRLTFKNNEFKNLKLFHFEGSNMTEISFEEGAASNLEKIVLSSTNNLESVYGIEGLINLKELEFNNNKLLRLFDKANQIAKVTLLGNSLEQGDLQRDLTFNKDDFPKLNLLTIESSQISNIIFNCGSTPNLKKIIWSLNKDATLSGIDNLPRLKALDLSGEFVPHEVTEAIGRHRNKLILNVNKAKNQEYAK